MIGTCSREAEVLQWHPAFYAGLQIELEEDRENLIFENEHQLSTKPMEIDVLVVKKEKDLPVRKNIGQIFRMYNIIEYKSPSDYLIDYSDAEELIREYGKHKNEQLYASVLDIIVRANKKKFEEVKVMCDALKELMMEDMKKELDAAMQIGIEQGIERGIEQGIEQGIERGIEQGIERGIQSTLGESILDFLSDFGEVPEDILSAVENEKDVILLKRYNKKAASVESIEEFRILLRQCIV